jgi:hypothetical protein
MILQQAEMGGQPGYRAMNARADWNAVTSLVWAASGIAFALSFVE